VTGRFADVYLGALLALLLGALAFASARRCARRLSWGGAGAVMAAATAAFVWFVLRAQDGLLLARLIPCGGVPGLGNGLGLVPAGVLAGVLSTRRLPGPSERNRRVLLSVALLLGAAAQAFRPLFGAPPETLSLPRAYWPGGVCPQTSESTCSAAAAATLLDARGIPAAEREMADLCLTRPDGTSMLGTYRGLRARTDGTAWRVRPLSGANVPELLLAVAEGGPVLISAGLDRFAPEPADPRYTSRWGWERGNRHAVVLLRYLPEEGRIEVADPAVGRERWHLEALDVLWNGEGLQLVPR